jgi:N-formylglutamate deformylase
MLAVGSDMSPDTGATRADFVLGDLNGRACEPGFTDALCQALRQMGYSVAINRPFQGAELVRRHGDPPRNRHSLQVEVNRGLYLDDRTLEPNEHFDRVRADLGRASAMLAGYVRASLGA